MNIVMTLDKPASGRFVDGAHRFPVRVYFEDTDLSGVVYHANYLRFMERARSEMLRCAGIDQRAALDAREGVYAIHDLSIKYHRPARLDDTLVVMSTVEEVGAATCVIHQRVIRGDELLTDARVVAAFLSLEGRPKRQPKAWIAAFETLNNGKN
jgi:acyl-CoA thioester hydrolase